jgi:hypothetical protein
MANIPASASVGLLYVLQSMTSLQQLELGLARVSNYASDAVGGGVVPQDIYQLAESARHLSRNPEIHAPDAIRQRVYELYVRDFYFFAELWARRHRPQLRLNGNLVQGVNDLSREVFRWWTSEDSIDRDDAEDFWQQSTLLERRQALNLFTGRQGFREIEVSQAKRISDWVGRYGASIEVGIETAAHRPCPRLILGNEHSAATTTAGGVIVEHTHPLYVSDLTNPLAYVRGTPSAFKEGQSSDDLRVLLGEAQESGERFFRRRVLHPFSGTIYTYDADQRSFELYIGLNEDRSDEEHLRQADERRECLLDHLSSMRRTVEGYGFMADFFEIPYAWVLQRKMPPANTLRLLDGSSQHGRQGPKLLHQILKFLKGE